MEEDAALATRFAELEAEEGEVLDKAGAGPAPAAEQLLETSPREDDLARDVERHEVDGQPGLEDDGRRVGIHVHVELGDRKSTRLNSSHGYISYAVFCLK